MSATLLFLLMIEGVSTFAGSPILIPNCTDSDGRYDETAVNCEDVMGSSYCGIYAAKHFYLADATFTKARKGGDALTRMIQCYSGDGITAGEISADQSYISAAVSTCPKTCGFCCLTPQFNCQNPKHSLLDCEKVTSAQCKDSKWRKLLAANCPNKCGFCLEGPCVDAAVDCDKDPSICVDPSLLPFARLNCKRTCGYCEMPKEGCGDTIPECHELARRGFCNDGNITEAGMGCGGCCSNGYDRSGVERTDTKKWTWVEWKRPMVAVILTFLCNVQNSMLAVGEWPYMATIDHDATSSFFGSATAVSKAGHAVFAFVFGVWAYKISGIKIPMLVGRCITLVASVMYIFVEFLPSNRRWWMLVCYLLFGVGFGTSPLLRSYIARVTSEENRSTAYALQTGASVLSAIVGPLAQISFAGLPYPGARIIYPNINLNIFTAPIWFATITNVIAIVLIIVVLDDPNDELKRGEGSSSGYSIAAIRARFSQLRSLNLPWILITLVIFQKVVSDLDPSTMSAVAGPVMTVMYSFPGETTVLIMAIAQVVVASLALALSILFFVCKLGRHVSCRVLYVFSNVVIIIGYVITYPFPFSSNHMQPFNETTRTGCNPLEYSWCDRQLAVNIVPFLIILIVTNSFAIPSAALSLDTIYSKMIGNLDQNLMQSLFVIVDDIVQIVGPLYGAAVFASTGLNLINIINGSIYIVGTILWIAAWKWLRPYA